MSELTLANLIDEAEKQGKWLRSYYQGVWFSPQELRDANARGQFRWGPVNWELRDPSELVKTAERDVSEAQQRLVNIRVRVTGQVQEQG